ncbi:TetR/AcrR family transcriptional regulator [Mycobacterium bourgelatii]|uniref:TetR/AcrR family transcriptional regulator n=1 Tax=Mycobacterium bourgelatii TaxID=1273442 RepID=UPI0013D32DD6|nr:TetR family transcriptional regulator [Mycobacterium bourgelatii]MCV6975080.1 TetR/AcrR family transcriptional regulator [Mycobacterium bourgelatii]
MTAVEDRPLRADAARNVDRIVRAARDVYRELGADAPIEAIARRAGVGERTLYRRFPAKADLVRATLESIAEGLTPTIEDARRADDPVDGIARLLEAAISLASQEHHLLTAAHQAGSLTMDISAELDDALAELARRGQEAGLIRNDLVADDLPRLIAMLHSVLWTMEPGSDSWRRYLALVLDAISTRPAQPLPPAPPFRYDTESSGWPL